MVGCFKLLSDDLCVDRWEKTGTSPVVIKLLINWYESNLLIKALYDIEILYL